MEQKDQLYRQTEQTQNYHVCKICCQQDQQNNLISPCQCKGSIQYTHKSCLLDWSTKKSIQILGDNDKKWYTHCQICNTFIPIKTKYVISLNNENQFRDNFLEYWWITLIFFFGIFYGLLTLISILLNIISLFFPLQFSQSTIGFVFGWDNRATSLPMMISLFNSLLFFTMFFLKVDRVAYDFDIGFISQIKAKNQKQNAYILDEVPSESQKKNV